MPVVRSLWNATTLSLTASATLPVMPPPVSPVPAVTPVIVPLPLEQPEPQVTVPSTDRLECMRIVLYGPPDGGKLVITRLPAPSPLSGPAEMMYQFAPPVTLVLL